MSEAQTLAVAQLKLDEGFRSQAYPDPLSGGAPFTVGYGATGAFIGPDAVWTLEEAEADLTVRVAKLDHDLAARVPCYVLLDPVRQSVLINLAYQIGVSGLLGFPKMLGHLAHREWDGAAAELINSALAHQTPARTARRAQELRTGISTGP